MPPQKKKRRKESSTNSHRTLEISHPKQVMIILGGTIVIYVIPVVLNCFKWERVEILILSVYVP